MNNLTIGGIDPRTGQPFAYYETIAGGMGARPGADGISGIHTHMTNSLNTPVEALEYAYPFRVRSLQLPPRLRRPGPSAAVTASSAKSNSSTDAQVTLLADRRIFAPYGLAGGTPGALGRSLLITEDHTSTLPGKCSLDVTRGSVIHIETPGGGGWGKPTPTHPA